MECGEVQEIDTVIPAAIRLDPFGSAGFCILERWIKSLSLARESLKVIALPHQRFLLGRMAHHRDVLGRFPRPDSQRLLGFRDQHDRQRLATRVEYAGPRLR